MAHCDLQRLAVTNGHAFNGTPAALLSLRENRTTSVAYAARHLFRTPGAIRSAGGFLCLLLRR